jgi:hypothetical protein
MIRSRCPPQTQLNLKASVFNAFETVLECLKPLEGMVMGMKQMRLYASAGPVDR